MRETPVFLPAEVGFAVVSRDKTEISKLASYRAYYGAQEIGSAPRHDAMDVLTRRCPEFGFGVDPFNPRTARDIEVIGATRKSQLKRQVMQSCPRVPGVYGMLDRSGQLIYVGKSKSLRSRLLSYFGTANETEKAGRIIENTRAIQWETQPSEFAALLREHQLIRQFSPRWNVQSVPKRQRPVYLCLGRSPAPYFFLSAKVPADYVGLQGPFFGAKRMSVAVDALNKFFHLRDCSQKQKLQFAEQLTLFEIDTRPGCLRLELGTCLGPCAAICSRQQYGAQVNAAESFLDGFNDEPLLELQERMERASAQRQYELAGRVHRALKALRYVHRKLTQLAEARRKLNFVYAVPGFDGCHNWYLIHGGEISGVAAAPRGREQYHALKPTLSGWKANLESPGDHGHGPYPYTLATVAGWFRKHSGELDRTFTPSQAGRKYYRKAIRA